MSFRLPPAKDSKGFLRAKRYFPGSLASATIAMAAMFLADQYGAPVMLFALLLGLAFNFLYVDGPSAPGIDFASSTVLRLGVALLGARITLAQIVELGLGPVLAVVVSLLLTILFGALLARVMGLSSRLGILSGGAVAICGASAALAISSVLPQNKEGERDTIFVVISVTTLSTLAMILYPPIGIALGLDDISAGVFLGGTIHDVAQVVGAGYSVSDTAGDVSTFTKLLRVAMLVPVVFALSLLFRRGRRAGGGRTGLVPPFLIGFVVLVGINSLGMVPEPIVAYMSELSRWCLVAAIAAIGMKTSFRAITTVGIKPVTLIVAETVFLVAVVLGFIFFIL
jgi:uncharacterized integral membrane protein (TIGR00698 family)